ncbi:MAG: hypothetical protein IPN34_14520 [Planctomycetes bacterium]|nr:hypothetical protein [Planctomycetota bacterium]
MFEAQLLISKTTVGTKVYSPWFPRQSDNATFQVEVVQRSDNATLKVEAVHKNSEDTGNGTEVTPAIVAAATAVDIYSAEITALKEMVRFKFTVTGTTGEWVLFRMLPTSWYAAVNAGNTS